MSIYKRIFSVLVLLLTLISINCSNYDESDNPDIPKVTRTQENSEAYYTVMADERLPETQKIAILQALNEWSTKTNFTMTYKLTFIDMSAVPADITIPHTIKVYERNPGPGLAGWTTWSASNHSAYMFIAPSMDGDLFRRVMLHELGHAFDLSFGKEIHYLGPNQSIMYPSIGQASSGLRCPDIKAFCEKHACIVECTDEPVSEGSFQSNTVTIAEHRVD